MYEKMGTFAARVRGDKFTNTATFKPVTSTAQNNASANDDVRRMDPSKQRPMARENQKEMNPDKVRSTEQQQAMTQATYIVRELDRELGGSKGVFEPGLFAQKPREVERTWLEKVQMPSAPSMTPQRAASMRISAPSFKGGR